MTEKQGCGIFHSRRRKRQSDVGLRVPSGGFERENGSLGVQKTVFGGATDGSLPIDEWSVGGQ